MFARSRFDLAPLTAFDDHIREVREMLGIAVPVADVVKPAFGPGLVSQIRKFMYRRADAEPGSNLGVIIEDHVLAQPEAQLLHHEISIGCDTGGQQVHMVNTTYGDATQGSLLRSIQKFGLFLWRSLVVLHVPQN